MKVENLLIVNPSNKSNPFASNDVDYRQIIIKILDFLCDIDYTVSASIVTLGLCTV